MPGRAIAAKTALFVPNQPNHNTGVSVYPMLNREEILRSAVKVEESGVHRFSMVTSGRGITGRDLEKILDIIVLLRRETSLSLCASLGIIDENQASMLAEAG